jgi:hypothetical protein
MLGPKVFRPVVEGIRSKLRSAPPDSGPQPTRKTPRFLRIVATPDDEQEERLLAEGKDNVVTLKWNVVADYVGPAAEIARANICTVH